MEIPSLAPLAVPSATCQTLVFKALGSSRNRESFTQHLYSDRATPTLDEVATLVGGAKTECETGGVFCGAFYW